jgi:SAM-dependent methyltransferase
MIMPNERAVGYECRICGNQVGNKSHRVREMSLGTHDPFTYVECAACGTLQIDRVPDLGPYYPEDYYSFVSADVSRDTNKLGLAKRVSKSLGRFVRRRAADYYCTRSTPFGKYRYAAGRLLARRMKRIVVGFPDYLKDARVNLHINRRSGVLDVGSGVGVTLMGLSAFGFKDLTGVDPFVRSDITYPNGIRVLKAEVSSLNRQFDLILANHCVEHVADPRAMLQEIRRLLNPGRYAIVRIPVLGRAWREYRADWVQLDPPRHLFLFSVQCFTRLAEEAGFAVEDVVHDSTAFQFWGSEQYRRDIPLTDSRSYSINPENSIFAAEQIADFEARATELNIQGEGDQAVFYLRRE